MKQLFTFLSVVAMAFSSLTGIGQTSLYVEDFGNNATVTLPYVYGTNATGGASKNANITSNPSWTQSNASANFAGVMGGCMSATISASGGTNVITCTFTVASGFTLSPSSLLYNYRISSTGAQKMDVTISGTTGSPASIAQVTTTRSGAFVGQQTSNFTTAPLLTGTITLTITFSSTTAGGSTVRLDEVTLRGTIAAAATAPVVSTTTANSITTTAASSGGNVSSDGGAAPVSARGVVYGTSPNPTIAGTKTTDATGTGTYTSMLSPLTVNTQYYYRAYATNSVGTAYGSENSFYTLANTPVAPTVNNATTTTLDVALNSDGNPSITQYAIQETGSGNYVQANGSLGATAVWQTLSTWGTKTVTGLASATSYTFAAKSRNGTFVETAFGTSASGTTATASQPTLSGSALTAFGNICLNVVAGPNSFTITGSNLTSANVTVGALAGYSYSLTSGGTYTSSLNITQGGGSFSQIVYVKFTPTAVQSYNGNIAVGGGGATAANVAASGAGVNTPPSPATGSASSITSTTATLAGTLTAGCETISAYGIEYSTTNNFVNGTGTMEAAGNLSSGAYTVNLSSLSANTTYYYKAYATTASGTTYAGQQTFTTAGLSAPVATAATNVTGTSFTANWNAVPGATSYGLDVSTSSSFSSTQSLASEGFENSLSLFSQTTGTGTFYSGNSLAGDAPASSPFAVAGTYGFGKSGSSVTITSSNINTTAASSVQMSFRLASFSVNSNGNGADATDIVTVEISPDGGTTYYSTVRVKGFSNATWAYSATGLASTAYDGNTTPVDFAPIAGGARTTDGYSTVTVTGLPATANLKVRITLLNDNVNERWLIDDLNVMGIISSILPGYNNLSVNGTSQSVTGLTSGNTYYYRVRANSANSTSANSNVINVTTTCASPTITGQPLATQTHCQNDAATGLSVTATGDGLMYQWYSNTNNINSNGALINGATSSSYSPSTATAGTSYYYVVVSGTCAPAATSSTAEVIVNAPPSVTTTGVLSCNGTDADLNAGVTSSTSGLTVTFYSDAALMTAISSTVTSSGTYYVKVDNGTCTASASIAVTIGTTPVITKQTVRVCEVNNFDLHSTITSNTTGLTLEFFEDAALTMSIPNGIVNNPGEYYLRASNGTCSFVTILRVFIITPTITCPASVTAHITTSDPAGCSKVVGNLDPTYNYSCSRPLTLSWKTTGATAATGNGINSLNSLAFNKGVSRVYYYVADADGNQTSCQSTLVTIIDDVPPVITCPADIAATITSGATCDKKISVPKPVITDNCSGVKMVSWTMSGATMGSSPTTGINYVGSKVFNKGVTTITYMAADAAGNLASSTCNFTVTVTDGAKPTLTNSRAFIFCIDPNMYYSVTPLTASDNCSPANTLDISYAVTGKTIRSGTGADASGTFNPGRSTITWTVKDELNNTATFVSTVTVSACSGGRAAPELTVTTNTSFDVKLSPNPTTGAFALQVLGASKEAVEINIFNSNGQKISSMKARSAEVVRFGESYQAGTYMIEVKQGAERATVVGMKTNK